VLSPLQPSTPPIIDQLTAYGYDTRVTSLPSVGQCTGLPWSRSADDAGYIQSVMSNFADEGKDIVHVMHSYGGVARSQNAQGLAEVDRTVAGKTPSISRMVYLASLILPVGKSVQMLAGGYQAWPRTYRCEYFAPLLFKQPLPLQTLIRSLLARLHVHGPGPQRRRHNLRPPRT
jgi:hypothetical protein